MNSESVRLYRQVWIGVFGIFSLFSSLIPSYILSSEALGAVLRQTHLLSVILIAITTELFQILRFASLLIEFIKRDVFVLNSKQYKSHNIFARCFL